MSSIRTRLGHEPISTSHWSRTAPEAPPCPALEGTIEADCTIIGAGYSGLIMALELAAAGRSVVVLDAEAPGWAASGRNAGHVAPLFWGAKKTPHQMVAAYGSDTGARMNRMIAGSGRWLFDLIDRHGITCDARKGYLCLARTDASLAKQRGIFAEWSEFGGEFETIDRNGLAHHVNSPNYAGGVWLPNGGLVNPLALSRGLAAAAVREGVRLFGNSRALSAAKDGEAWRIQTAQGVVRSQTLLVAAGGYADALFPALRKTAYTVHCGVIATDPLPDEGTSTLPSGTPIADLDDKAVFSPAIDAEGCLVISFLIGPGDLEMRKALKICAPRIAKAFPQFAPPEFKRIWAGKFTITPDGAPRLLRLADNAFAATGCNGLGHTLGISAARELAKLALGVDEDTMNFRVQDAKPLPASSAANWLLRHVAFPLVNRAG